ncbi:3-oxoacyl-[acyl-carrier-protein] synthase, KASIII [Minicystis rosea]|nr:3-oxoacyl-[acyl-carrier-protein] synthase, KASIII [Minicystis rosea]
MIPVRILGTASALPGAPIATEAIVARDLPSKDPAVILAKTGVRTRHWAEPGALAADLATQALRDAAATAGIDVRDLRRVILVTSTGGDHIGPATANTVIHALGLDDRCDGFDLVNACMGFVSAFDLAARSVATGLHPVGIVATETMSRFIHPDEPRPYVVFGDGAAAAVLGPGRPGEGVLGSFLRNDGAHSGTVFAAHPMLTRKIERVQFALPNADLGRIVVDALRRGAQAVLDQCGEDIKNIEWVLPHQPNGAMLDLIVETFGIERSRMVPVVGEVGSLVSASIPTSLDRLMRTRDVKPGDRILMIGVGSGLAYGAILYRVAS